jgi:hypothetical protein
MRCEDVAPLLVFYICDEITSEERAQIDAHLATCSECRAQLTEEDALQTAIDQMPQAADQFESSGVLLSQCRSELAEKLDELAAPKVDEGWQPFGLVRRWMALRPAWSAAALLLVGAIIGTQLYLWLPGNTDNGNGPGLKVLAAQNLTADQLNNMTVSGVSFAKTGGNIQVQLNAEQPMTLTSDQNGADVRQVLTFVVSNSDRFDAGVRLDCVEALRAAVGDEQARAALLAAARKDQNPAVRLKAIDALRDMAGMPAVRDALLDALQRDPNPGVRVEAINLLVRAMEAGNEMPEMAPEAPDSDVPMPAVAPQAMPGNRETEQRILRALDEIRQRDSNRYVRLRSAAALRQIAQQDMQ